jgi:6-phosphogluconolactonase
VQLQIAGGNAMSQPASDTAIVYVGTYTQVLPHVQGAAEGIYVYRLDLATGRLEHLSTAPGVVNPSFVTVDAAGRYLYAVQETGDFDGQPGGAVSALAIDPSTHTLSPINYQLTHGAHPCYAGIDHSGRWLLVANYSGGSASVFPIQQNGGLGPPSAVVQHHGPHPHHDGPHPHSAMSTPDGAYVLVPDCGLDRIAIYRLDTANGTLAEHQVPWVALQPGAGPRHLAFHPSGAYVYCINERNSTLTAFAYEPVQGVLRELQTLSTLPEGFAGPNSCADIHLDPSGRYVYGSNRGHNSIASFAVDAATGMLRPLGHTPTGGRIPRNFGIDPTGAFLLAANQDTNNVVTFRIDPATGALEATGEIAKIPSPVCVCIVAPPA